MNQTQAIHSSPRKIISTQQKEKFEKINLEKENFSSLLKKTLSKDDNTETKKTLGSEINQTICKDEDQEKNHLLSDEEIAQNQSALVIVPQVMKLNSDEQNLSSEPTALLIDNSNIFQTASPEQVSVQINQQTQQNLSNGEPSNNLKVESVSKNEQQGLTSLKEADQNIPVLQSQVVELSDQYLKSEVGARQQNSENFNVKTFTANLSVKSEKLESFEVVSNAKQLNAQIQQQTNSQSVIANTTLKADSEQKAEFLSSESNSEQKVDLKIDDTDKLKPENFALFTGESQVIKVSDSSSEIGQPISRQIVNETITNLKNDVSEFKMQLNPKDLGEISVKMLSKNGILTVELTAANPKTQSLLSINAESIRSILQTTNEKTIEISCPQQEQANNQNMDQQSSSSDGRQQRQHEQSNKTDDDSMFSETNNFLSFMQQIRQNEVQAI